MSLVGDRHWLWRPSQEFSPVLISCLGSGSVCLQKTHAVLNVVKSATFVTWFFSCKRTSGSATKCYQLWLDSSSTVEKLQTYG